MQRTKNPASGRIETFRGRHLREGLRDLRHEAGMSTEDVAKALDWSKGKISRLENGVSGIRPSDVRLLATIYGIAGSDLDTLLDLARAARARGWWAPYADLFSHSYLGLESEATRLLSYETLLVPGLLQTEEYVYALIRGRYPEMEVSEVRRRVEVRLARQALLTKEDAPAILIVLGENVLRCSVGGSKVVRRQLIRIAEVSALPNVSIQVLERDRGSTATGIAFSILGFPTPSESAIVYIEHLTGELYVDDLADVMRYQAAFDQLMTIARNPCDSAEMILRTAGEVTR